MCEGIDAKRCVIQEDGASEEAQDVMEDLIALAQPLQGTIVVWRGIRSVDDTFGMPAERLDDLIEGQRASAHHEFTVFAPS